MVEVRRATREDADWLLMQLRDFERALGRKRGLIEDEAYARASLAALIEYHVVLVAHEGARRDGFIAGYKTPHPLNPKIRVLSEIFWWVEPARRHTRAGAVLLNTFEAIGRAEADWVVLSLEHDSPIRDAHLTKRGFKQVERAYLLEV